MFPARAAVVPLVVAAWFAANAPSQPPATPPTADPPRFALLVGCTVYPNQPALRELKGPLNDAKQWGDLLTTGFGFPAGNVTRLVGWPADPAARPTEANIRKGFEDLIARAKPGSQVVICMSGHGMQVPLPPGADPLDPKNYEPDGFDEVFLPADVRAADKDGQIPGAIVDDQIGVWLDRLEEKGAHVFIVFDSCHSGTMTRSGPAENPREVARVADPLAIGITREQIDDAARRAQEAAARAPKGDRPRERALARPQPAGGKAGGSVVAFYAAQPFEEALELPLPEGAVAVPENYFGLLTFSMLQSLSQRGAPLTYRELNQSVSAQVRYLRGARGPVPFAEGDLDREVLGYRVWPDRGVLPLTRTGGVLKVGGGELRGVTPGSILSVHAPRSNPADPKSVLGYVRVESATPSDAVVAPCEFEGQVKAEEKDLLGKDGPSQCRVAARDYGDLRVKLFAPDHPVVKAALAALDKDVAAIVRTVPTEAEADWVLRPASPAEAAERYRVKIAADSVLLARPDGQPTTPAEAKAAADRLAKAGRQVPRRAFAAYPAETKGLTAALDLDLPKLFRWQNVWRVAGGVSGERAGAAHGVTFTVVKLKDEKDKGPGESIREGTVAGKTVLGFRLKNDGPENVWVVGLYLDAQMEIAVYEVIPLASGAAGAFSPGEVVKAPGEEGTEGMVVFVIPQTQRERPDFRFLEQSPLRQPDPATRAARSRGAPESPFGALLRSATVEGTRSPPRRMVDTTPGVLVQSWYASP